jgi:hypothetical protein
MRVKVMARAPRRQEANTIKNDAVPAIASPIPGIHPISASSPKSNLGSGDLKYIVQQRGNIIQVLV